MRKFLLGYARKATAAAATTLGASILLATTDGHVTWPEVVIGLGATAAAALAVFATTNTSKASA